MTYYCNTSPVMTMSVHLLVLTFACACACALGIAIIPPAPPYGESLTNVHDTFDMLERKVLSMEGNIPLLNDPRRHYAEIINVIHYEAKVQSGCLHRKYSEDYQTNLNESGPEGINNPEAVIAAVQKLFNTFEEKTKELQSLIQDCVGTVEGCNAVIDQQVKKNPERYDPQTKTLTLASKFVFHLKNKAAKFEDVANNFAANEFVIKGEDDLENVTMALSNLYRELYPLRPVQSC